MESQTDLSGKLLIAMPGMGDPRFEKAVILLCAHSDDGAMGLMVNKPATDLKFVDLLDQLGIPKGGSDTDIRVYFGGPVENGRGFVLHSADYDRSETTLTVDGQFCMTATVEILEHIVNGEGPERSLLALGYAGWGPGQLESEILQNGWLTCDASADLVFSGESGSKWERALGTIGVDPRTLSATAGRA